MATLRQAFSDITNGSYTDTPAYKFLDVEVVSEHNGTVERWPGIHKNVYSWVKLANGKAVGWNENPGKGWSFPIITLKGK